MQAIFAIDRTLARIVEEAREPVLAQLKLAWWREQCERGRRTTPELTALARSGGDSTMLVPLVDWWEREDAPPAERGALLFALIQGRESAATRAAGEFWGVVDAGDSPAIVHPSGLAKPLRVLLSLARSTIEGRRDSRRALLRAALS